MNQKAWGGRFSGMTAVSVERFTASIDVDQRLYAYDIDGSIAHCRTLAKAGVILEAEAAAIINGLEKIRRDIEAGQFEFSDSLEDIHMHIEDRLVKDIGDVAKKLHTARSRNDQVALDVRLYLRDHVGKIIEKLGHLRSTVVDFAQENLRVILPGYTHLQRAQPVLLSHHFMAYYEMMTRDAMRLSEALKRINVMPLGSAALAGTTFPIDREYAAKLLNFPEISKNSIDAVSDRDFIIEFLSAASLCMMHLSRLSEEMILWSSSEFGFIHLPDAFTTGSSIMPQKKNPDVPELVRGKCARVFGSLIAGLTLMKSLPLAYNRDMQEDKVLLFDAVDTLVACIDIYCDMMPKINVREEEMYRAAVTGHLNATDLADYLTAKAMPFREAHHVAGAAVVYAIQQQKELNELDLVELQKFSGLISEDVFEALTPEKMIDRRKSFGGTAVENVKKAILAAYVEMDGKG
jgi:argininosuccinate lyase